MQKNKRLLLILLFFSQISIFAEETITYKVATKSDVYSFPEKKLHNENETYEYGRKPYDQYYCVNGTSCSKKQIVKSNPGFAPLSINGEGVKAFGKLFAHPNGYLYLLGHLSEICVTEKDPIYPGKLVAKVGNTGNCKSSGGGDGSHLHLSVYKAEGWEDIVTGYKKKGGIETYENYVKDKKLLNPFDFGHTYKD